MKTQCNRTLSFLWASAQSVFRITHPSRSLNSVASGFFVAHAEREIKEVCQNRQSAALLSLSGLGSQYSPCARFLSTLHILTILTHLQFSASLVQKEERIWVAPLESPQGLNVYRLVLLGFFFLALWIFRHYNRSHFLLAYLEVHWFRLLLVEREELF